MKPQKQTHKGQIKPIQSRHDEKGPKPSHTVCSGKRQSGLNCCPGERPSSSKPATILLVEDNPANREFYRQAMGQFGCKVMVAASGEHALEVFKQEKFDLVFMDCEMPGIDGFTAAKQIRTIERKMDTVGKKTPIIALTAHTLPEDREKCIASGMDDYLAKPFQLNELVTILNKWLPESESKTFAAQDYGKKRIAFIDSEYTVLNPKALDNIKALEKAGSRDLINRIAQLFFKNAPKLILIIQKSVLKLDANMIRKAAHSLKSASSNLGAQRLSIMSNELEQLASKDKITDLQDRVRAMEKEYRRVKKALDIELERRNS